MFASTYPSVARYPVPVCGNQDETLFRQKRIMVITLHLPLYSLLPGTSMLYPPLDRTPQTTASRPVLRLFEIMGGICNGRSRIVADALASRADMTARQGRSAAENFLVHRADSPKDGMPAKLRGYFSNFIRIRRGGGDCSGRHGAYCVCQALLDEG